MLFLVRTVLTYVICYQINFREKESYVNYKRFLHIVAQEYVSPRMDGFHVGFPDQCPQVGNSLALGMYSHWNLIASLADLKLNSDYNYSKFY